MSKMTINKYGHQVWRNEAAKIHRVDGPAYIHPNGSQGWFIDGKLHCLDGPAIIWANGTQEWYIDGKLHRIDGPAYIHANGSQEWWINHINLTNQVKSWIKENNFPHWALWTDGQKMIFRLAFSGIRNITNS